MSLGHAHGRPTEGDEKIALAFKHAQYGSDPEQWRKAAQALFESLTPYQKDVLGEFQKQSVSALPELIRLCVEWRAERIDHQVDWVTRSLWPLK